MLDWVALGKLIYDGALVATLVVAIRFGARDERIGIGIIVIAGGATALNLAVSVGTGLPARYGLFAIDICALLAFDALMVRSFSFWPIWATGVQLAAVALDFAKVITTTPKSHLWVQGKFAYLLLLFIVLGAVRRTRWKGAT